MQLMISSDKFSEANTRNNCSLISVFVSWGKFTYRSGAISDLKEAHPNCKKSFRFADVDLTLVPRLIKDSLQRAGGDAKVIVVYLGRGVFCKKVGWIIRMENGARASRIEYKLDGKFKKIWP